MVRDSLDAMLDATKAQLVHLLAMEDSLPFTMNTHYLQDLTDRYLTDMRRVRQELRGGTTPVAGAEAVGGRPD